MAWRASPSRMAIPAALRAAQQRIRDCVSALAARGVEVSEPRLVAVSKTKPNEAVLEAYEAGQRHFGENYVQELADKAKALPDDIQWHFIGHLQSNKARMVAQVPNLFAVETVDSAKLANKLNSACEVIGREELGVFVQVNVSGEGSKSGVEPVACEGLVRHVLDECPRLRLRGLMTIGKTGDTTTKYFKILAAIREDLRAAGITALPDPLELSMGMSADFGSAIEAGSSSVRLGSTIFGARDYSKRQ